MVESTNAQGRVIRATFASLPGGGFERQVRTSILLESQGDESSTSFSLNFNPSVFTNPVVALGSGLPAASNLDINTSKVAQGQLGVIVSSTNIYSAGTRNIINVTFIVPANATFGIHPIGFGGVPTPQSVSDSTGALLATTYQLGFVQIGTANGISVSGRVVTPEGRGIRNATVVVSDGTDGNGNRRTATTSSFGYYFFAQVGSGQTYTISVQSKRYRFTPRVVQVGPPLADFDFIGQQ